VAQRLKPWQARVVQVLSKAVDESAAPTLTRQCTYEVKLTPEQLQEWAYASESAHVGLSEEDKELRQPGESDEALWRRLWCGGPWGAPDC